MPHDPDTATTPANRFAAPNGPAPRNPFVAPDRPHPDPTNPPGWTNPFEGPPEPPRSVPEAKLEASSRAYGEWREYLPHGLSLADYEPYRASHVRYAAISSATKPLIPVLPPDEVMSAAEAAADEAFDYVAHLLSQYEPDHWINHNLWYGR